MDRSYRGWKTTGVPHDTFYERAAAMLTKLTGESSLPEYLRRGHHRSLQSMPDLASPFVPSAPANETSNFTRPAPMRSSTDPLAEFISAWPEIVGQHVASLSRPAAILGGKVLRVTVISSAWANQMAYGAPKILAKLNTLVPATSALERLTYHVGALPQREMSPPPVLPSVLQTPTQIARELRGTADESPAASIAEALARCRRTVTAVRERYIAQGGRVCSCGVLIATVALKCRVCLDSDVAARRLACAHLLHRNPAVTSDQACRQIENLTVADFGKVRRNRICSYYDEIVRARDLLEHDKPIDELHVVRAAAAFVALETRLGPDVSAAIRRNTLGDLYDFVVSLERYCTGETQKRVQAAKAVATSATPQLADRGSGLRPLRSLP